MEKASLKDRTKKSIESAKGWCLRKLGGEDIEGLQKLATVYAAEMEQLRREMQRLRIDSELINSAWTEEIAASKRKSARIAELEKDLKQMREVFQHTTKANEQLSDLLETHRSDIRNLQARESSARTVKAVWDASESLLDLTQTLQTRIRKFKTSVGSAYALEATEKN